MLAEIDRGSMMLAGLAVVHILLGWILAWRRGRRARRRPSATWSLQATPAVSILVPAWNEHSVLGETLTALRRVEYPHWEAVIVAGGSDGTEAYAREICRRWPNFTVLTQPPRGKNAALNIGYAQAQGEILVLLDADCLVKPDWLARLVAPLTYGRAAAQGNYFALETSPVTMVAEMEKIAAYQIHGETVLQGRGSIALRREVLERLGGFPEEVTVGVDWDLDRRLKRQGAGAVFVPEAQVQTYMPADLRSYCRDQLRWRLAHLQALGRFGGGSSRGWTALISGLRFYMVALAFLLTPLAGLVLMPLSTWPLRLAGLLCGWILLRRIGLAVEVYSYTRRPAWLWRSWAPPALLVLDFACGLAALLSCRRKEIFFKGPRPERSKDAAQFAA